MVRSLSRPRTAVASLAALGVAACLLSGCEAVQEGVSGAAGAAESDAATSAAPDPGRLRTSVRAGAEVAVDRLVRVTAKHATLDRVRVTHPDGKLPGKRRDNGDAWVATERLEPGVTYTVSARGTSEQGKSLRLKRQFSAEPLALSEQTYASIAPLDGETVGVGMPVIVKFDVPVTERARFERHMSVSSTPKQPGTWHWLSDSEVHWRPREYWQPGTEVSVDLNVNGLAAGNGIYGQHDRSVDFRVGDAHVYEVDIAAHRMKVHSNGTLLRTLPITAGKPEFPTRSGVKVIMAKHRSTRMNSETVGIPVNSDEGYDLDNVEYAMRLTHSGEFIHAAPWSVASQGSANVSHGCTGLSTANAGWLYSMTRRGDVVEFVGSDRPMDAHNGYGDWNVPYSEYREKSALAE